MSKSCGTSKPFQQGKAPTVVTAKFFLPSEDAENLWTALQSSSVDTATIINILANRTLTQRLDIINQYKQLHDADLVQDLKDKLSGDFEDTIVAMMTPLDEYYASELNHAIAGLGTDESVLIEVLCTLNNTEIKAVRRAYHTKYNTNLEDDIIGDTSGYFKELLVAICRTERNEWQNADQDQAVADASALFNATGDARWSIFSDVLVHRSYQQLRLIFNAYENLAGETIEKAIQNYFSGDEKNGLLAIVGSVKNPAKYFAQKLYESMAGIGTNDRGLIRVVVTRSEIDMADIKTEYADQYSGTLAAAIIDDTSGDYQKCLLTLIGEA